MPRRRKWKSQERSIEHYDHQGMERLNNPPVGLGDYESDEVKTKKKFNFDPHLDPQLVWAQKAARTSFEVDVVSLHVHACICIM